MPSKEPLSSSLGIWVVDTLTRQAHHAMGLLPNQMEYNMNTPHPDDLTALVEHTKVWIEPRTSEDDETPGILLTVGWDPDNGNWDWQSGNNTYHGNAYGFPIWAVVDVRADTDTRDVVENILLQLEEEDQIDK